MCEGWLLFSDVLYMLVRYANPSGPMCLRCLMLTLSGLVEFFLLCFIAAWTCVVVSLMLVVCSFECFHIYVYVCFVCIIMFDCVGELFVEVNVFSVNVFSLKVIGLFLGCVGFLLANPCIVFQRVCVLSL